MGLLDSSGGGGGLPCGLGSQLLPWGLSSGGLASGLLGASHVDFSEGISDFWNYKVNFLEARKFRRKTRCRVSIPSSYFLFLFIYLRLFLTNILSIYLYLTNLDNNTMCGVDCRTLVPGDGNS